MSAHAPRATPRLTFEVAVVVAYMLIAARFFHDPSTVTRTSVGEIVGPFTYAWNGLWLLGGAGYLAGLWVDPLRRVREASLRLLIAAWLLYAAAILGAQGDLLGAGAPLLFAVAGVGVARDLARQRRSA